MLSSGQNLHFDFEGVAEVVLLLVETLALMLLLLEVVEKLQKAGERELHSQRSDLLESTHWLNSEMSSKILLPRSETGLVVEHQLHLLLEAFVQNSSLRR